MKECKCGCGRPAKEGRYAGKCRAYLPRGKDVASYKPIGTRRLNPPYWEIKVADGRAGWVREHRWLMEQKLGRKLDRKEHVHHRNHDTMDNRLENLELLQASEHHRHHAKEMYRRDPSHWFKKRIPQGQWS